MLQHGRQILREFVRRRFCLSLTSASILLWKSVLSMTTVTRPLSDGSITVSLSFLGYFSACCSSLVKLCSCIEADCIVEAILLLL